MGPIGAVALAQSCDPKVMRPVGCSGLSQLRCVKGMGPVKLEQYGEEILANLRQIAAQIRPPRPLATSGRGEVNFCLTVGR
jgi:hypothetical protein